MLPAYRIPQGPFGVVLNANAGRVTPRLARNIGRMVGHDHVFLTESQDHAKEALKTCMEREYPTVFAGGGDGTIIDAVNTMRALRTHDDDYLPAVGVLRLGTGNALARYLGSGRPARMLANYQAGKVHRSVPIRMVSPEGTLFPFAGLGTDAAVLNDYDDLRRKKRGTHFESLCSGLSGYLLAGLGKTLPRYLRRGKVGVRVVNLGRPAWRVGPDGNELGDCIPTGGVLYDGTCSMIGAATTPILGYGIRFFPFADTRPGRFQLRLIDMDAVQTAWNMIPAARGTLNHPDCYDFTVDRVRVSFDCAMPYQMGGDARGWRSEVNFGVSEVPVTFIGQA